MTLNEDDALETAFEERDEPTLDMTGHQSCPYFSSHAAVVMSVRPQLNPGNLDMGG